MKRDLLNVLGIGLSFTFVFTGCAPSEDEVAEVELEERADTTAEIGDQCLVLCDFDELVCRPTKPVADDEWDNQWLACQYVGTEGEFCTSDFHCEDNLFCEGHDTTLQQSGICQVGEREPIPDSEFGDPCIVTCGVISELVCRPMQRFAEPDAYHSEWFACLNLAMENEFCSQDYQCVEGLSCVGYDDEIKRAGLCQ